MAIITTWSSGTLTVAADENSVRLGVIDREVNVMEPGYIRITCEEAVKLRDDLSRAIAEVARNSALAVAATEEAGAAIARAAVGDAS